MLCYVTPKEHLGLPNKRREKRQYLRTATIRHAPQGGRHAFGVCPGAQYRDNLLRRGPVNTDTGFEPGENCRELRIT